MPIVVKFVGMDFELMEDLVSVVVVIVSNAIVLLVLHVLLVIMPMEVNANLHLLVIV